MIAYDKPIIIQKLDVETEKWSDMWSLHASVNKMSQSENFTAGATRNPMRYTFTVRYVKALNVIEYDTQLYRIQYKGIIFNIFDYDDFKEEHMEIVLRGEAYGRY